MLGEWEVVSCLALHRTSFGRSSSLLPQGPGQTHTRQTLTLNPSPKPMERGFDL
jgi:hypothetical protein